MDLITIHKLNEVYLKIDCDPGIAMEMSEYFTFTVPGAQYTPMYRNKMWDGKIRLFNVMARTLYAGLKNYVEEFASQRSYQVALANPDDFLETNFSLVEAQEFVSSSLANLPHTPRDYQLAAFTHAVRTKRSLLLSPTASGKSLIIYMLSRYLHEKQTLIIVPTTSLVHQMSSDFVSYGCDPKWIHKIHSGEEKTSSRPFVITTWQSVYKIPKPWFRNYSTVIGDEAHLFKAKSLTSILSKMDTCAYRYGFTGTLDGSHTNKLVLEGLFGPVKKVTTTAELIEQKHLSAFKIKGIVLRYGDTVSQQSKKLTYHDEVGILNNNQARNLFIVNLVRSLQGNTLLLFKVRDHGEQLHGMLQQKLDATKQLYYVDGTVDGEERESVRHLVEQQQGAVIVASVGTFSTGVNIRNLHNIVFASPSKSRIRTLQSIGRSLRKSEHKEMATLYDIADDMSWKSHRNFTLLHFMERMKMYDEEQFEYKLYNVRLTDV